MLGYRQHFQNAIIPTFNLVQLGSDKIPSALWNSIADRRNYSGYSDIPTARSIGHSFGRLSARNRLLDLQCSADLCWSKFRQTHRSGSLQQSIRSDRSAQSG